MTISSREPERARSTLPREDITKPAAEPVEQADLSRDERLLTEETRRRAAHYASKLAAALRGANDAR